MSNFDFTKTLLSGNKQYIDKITNDIAEKANNPDWNNLKNRPFYEEPTETSILSGTYEFEMWADFYGSTLPYTELTIGVIYDVIFDGITYSNLECRASENPDIKSYLGSSYDELLNDNHKYNFTIHQEVEFFTVYTTSTESSHSIEIIEKESTIKTLDSKYIPATIARVEYVDEKVVQPDWNQNDETASDFIKNRPFWTKDSSPYFSENNLEIEFEDYGYDNVYSAWVDTPFIEGLFERNDIKLTIDGVQYDGEGNRSLIYENEDDTGEPFALSFYNYEDDDCGIEIHVKKELGTNHIIDISFSISEIVQIPEKYIPPVATCLICDNEMIKYAYIQNCEKDPYNWAIVYGGEMLHVNVPVRFQHSCPTFFIEHYEHIDIPETVGQTNTITKIKRSIINTDVFKYYLNDSYCSFTLITDQDSAIPMSHKWVNSKIHAKGFYVDDENRCAIVSFVQTTDADPNNQYVFNYEIKVTRIF